MFTCNPVSGNTRQTMICAQRGFGAQMVSGNAQGDTYVVEKETCAIASQLTRQAEQMTLGEVGTSNRCRQRRGSRTRAV